MSDRDTRTRFEEWLSNYPSHKYLDRTIKRYIRALDKAGEWLQIDLPVCLLEIDDHKKAISEMNRIRLLHNFEEVNQSHGHGDLSAAMRLYGQFLSETNETSRDTRRDQLIGIVEREFIGPDPIDWEGMIQSNGEEIIRTDPPHIRYLAGILYPREAFEEPVEEREGEDIPAEKESEDYEPVPSRKSGSGVEYLENAEELINRSNAYRQSAISLTVAIKHDDEIRVSVSAGVYTTITGRDPATEKEFRYWPRTALEWENDGNVLTLPDAHDGIVKMPVNGTHLQFDITYRYSRGDSDIFTFTLENTKSGSGSSVKDDDCFFQTRFCIYSELGFSALSDGQRITKDEDYVSNQLLYRNVHNYAIGHGTAADWDDGETVKWISTATFPKYDIKPIVPSAIEGVSLEMLKMSPYGNFQETLIELREMCSKYRSWINELRKEKTTLAAEYEQTAARHIANCETCLSRMEAGVKLLEENETVRMAFQYMNLAMLMQQLHYNLPLQRWSDIGVLENSVPLPDVKNQETWYGDKSRYGKWRPFQLAFVLMNLRSMYYRDCNEREIVDLIWFPTGGGKTEAYLGLSAYTIFVRRLLNKDDKGTAILMRYTLRLLTAQQYERASAMICACDLIRREHPDLFGSNRITIGLWVGGTTTPNSVKEALKEYDKLYNGDTKNPFVILKCPWCGAQMGPVRKALVPGYRKYKKAARSFDFSFRCSNTRCDFSSEDLPLYVIDESIYEKTPTLLLGTVDKFAMLPFRPQAQSLFGFDNGVKLTSPDLIIQDELHLISGPLGSMVGHYETLINELCTIRTASGEIKPKIVASTATISRAKEQCHALYGCGRDKVFQFPPSGLDAGNSFFAKEDKNQNGRRYVGILATGSSSDATTAIRLFASLLYGAKAIKVEKESDRDPYWTNMGYYNSIRELGQAATWIRADIDQQLDVMYKRRYDDKRYSSREEYRKARRYIWRDEELTSRISGSEVTASLANLGIRYPAEVDDEGKVKAYPIDICLATNMISVGLDVSRLGLMTVAGQPKTTSEYIQATSRVGRNAKDAPGLVFVLYRPGRPRDKSHYEHFKSYHSRVYCNVEPTSVTPFSAPVRERALHAIMIGMLRLENDNVFNEDPPKIPDEEMFDRVCEIIENRVDEIDSDELDATREQLKYILECWQDWNPRKWEPKLNPDWSYADPLPLMYTAGSQPNAAWGEQGMETPTSMRSVDASCEAEILSNRYTAKEG